MTDTLPERLIEIGDSFDEGSGSKIGDALREAAAEIKGLSLTAQIAEKHVLEIGDALDAKDQECFALAANQCHDGYVGEYGNHCCRKVEAAEAECERLREALARITLGSPGHQRRIAEDALGIGND